MQPTEIWRGTTVVLGFSRPVELDDRTGPRLKETIRQAVAEGARVVIMDLSAVTFADSVGLGVLISGLKTLRARGGRFVLVAPQEEVRQVLEVTNLVRAFDVLDSVAEALSSAACGTPVAWAE